MTLRRAALCGLLLAFSLPAGVAHHAGPIVDPRPGPAIVEAGLASWYGPGFHGRMAADGSIFNENAMTAAHRTLPFGTVVEVYCLATCRVVRVVVTDRGPFVPGRVIDLSRRAAQALGIEDLGVATVGVYR